MNIHELLKQAGVRLPELAATAQFLRVKLIDDLAFVSGHAPFEDGDFRYIGRIGREFGLSSERQAAKLAVLGCLTSLETPPGSLERVQEIVKLNGFVNCIPEFHDRPQITDAASHLLIDLFGDSGRHAQTRQSSILTFRGSASFHRLRDTTLEHGHGVNHTHRCSHHA